MLDLGLMPLANDFTEPGGEQAGYAPLRLMFCPRCTLAQLSVVVNPRILYSKYPYVTSHSATMLAHFKTLRDDLSKQCLGRSVVEIGSNDGTLLDYLSQNGFTTVLGVEPAANLCDLASKKGIATINEFFNPASAVHVIQELGGTPDLVIARHVFCHIDDWADTIGALTMICGKNTLVAVEVPYFPDTIRNGEWDQVYHEHLSYMTTEAMKAALTCSCLHISKVAHYPIHGGAIVMLLRRNDCGIEPDPLPPEKVTLEDLKAFAKQAAAQLTNLSKTVRDLVAQGKTVVGYGASAKATQWIKSCGFTRKEIRWVCDNTITKIYKHMPGTLIPVVDDGALTRELPDYAVCFAWNFATEIIAKEAIFKAKGGKWIIPVPEVKIV